MRNAHAEESALKNLARQTNTPPEEVTEVYRKEVADLEATAKVKTYIPALALRRARETLRKRRHAPVER